MKIIKENYSCGIFRYSLAKEKAQKRTIHVKTRWKCCDFYATIELPDIYYLVKYFQDGEESYLSLIDQKLENIFEFQGEIATNCFAEELPITELVDKFWTSPFVIYQKTNKLLLNSKPHKENLDIIVIKKLIQEE